MGSHVVLKQTDPTGGTMPLFQIQRRELELIYYTLLGDTVGEMFKHCVYPVHLRSKCWRKNVYPAHYSGTLRANNAFKCTDGSLDLMGLLLWHRALYSLDTLT